MRTWPSGAVEAAGTTPDLGAGRTSLPGTPMRRGRSRGEAVSNRSRAPFRERTGVGPHVTQASHGKPASHGPGRPIVAHRRAADQGGAPAARDPRLPTEWAL